MRVHTFESDVLVPAPLGEVFAFFSDPFNLAKITPPWLRFRVLASPPLDMRVGTLIDYRLRVRGIPFGWRSKITAWEPPRAFVDEQVAGPYRVWIHEHSFAERESGTLVGDRVRYAVPLDFLLAPLFVRRDVRAIFAFRAARLAEIFGTAAAERAAGAPAAGVE